MPVTTFGTLGTIAEVPAVTPAVPVVYLHGWGRSRQDFAAIARQRPGMAIDLPGFGSSPPPPAAMGSRDYATHVLEASKQWAGSEPLLIVAHSFGGRIGLQMAASAPAAVRGLIIAGVPLFRNHSRRKPSRRKPSKRNHSKRKPPLRYRTIRTFHKLKVTSDSQLERARLKYGSADYVAATGVMREVFVEVVNESYEPQLTQIRCPTAFVWGTFDTAAPLSHARRAHQMVAGSTLETRDCGHDIHLEHPHLFVELIDRFTLS
ncbi:MAG: alpha/beta hydrolase [Acidimicrobiia bacterium]|nr:alpha/beta hydrolase [Acidimicrobiia bacterium]MCY4457967.1 alpha/beta hydrolase [Acidimicrobiaceae bacterium]